MSTPQINYTCLSNIWALLPHSLFCVYRPKGCDSLQCTRPNSICAWSSRKQDEVKSNSTITLLKALACAEIDMNKADIRRIMIKNGSNAKISTVNFKEFLTSYKPDVELETATLFTSKKTRSKKF